MLQVKQRKRTRPTRQSRNEEGNKEDKSGPQSKQDFESMKKTEVEGQALSCVETETILSKKLL